MAAGGMRVGINAASSAEQELSRALLIIGGGILTYELVSKLVHIIAGKTFKTSSAPWVFPVATTTAFMLNAAFLKVPKLQAQFLALCIFYVGVSIAAKLLKENKASSSSSLPDYMVDMVQEAKDGAYSPKIGYEAAVAKVEAFMNLSQKSNALLLAEPGVGKSTIPKTIAYKIAKGLYPKESVFAGAKLMHVTATDLTAGTIYRGMLEKRVQEMIRLAKKDPKIIYFIDEIHVLVGGGREIEHKFDISEMLKEAMAGGEIRILGASTFDDYERYIRPKTAFARRLPKVEIKEPTPPKCFEMLKHSYAQLRQGEQIKVSDRAIAAAIHFIKGHTENHFPDKAIDIINFAVSRAEMQTPSAEKELVLDVRQIVEAYIMFINKEDTLDVDLLTTQFESYIEHHQNDFPGLV